MSKITTIFLSDEADAVLDAIARQHRLRGRSEAVRHILSALAPVYGLPQFAVVAQRGRPAGGWKRAAAHEALLSLDDIRSLPLEARPDFVAWYNDGKRPGEAALAAAAAVLSPERLAAIVANSAG